MDYLYLKELFERCLNSEYEQVEDGGSFCVCEEGDHLYLLFEKSNGVEDWINNLSYGAVSAGEAGDWYCHEGFLRVWQSVLPYVERYVSDPQIKKITTVGYSHGAALAVLCHEYVWDKRRENAAIEGYGFGCPRVVFGFAPEEGERWRDFYVIRNIDDAVTHLPPRLLGYRHVGRLIEIGKRGRYSPVDAHREENYIIELENMSMRWQTT